MQNSVVPYTKSRRFVVCNARVKLFLSILLACFCLVSVGLTASIPASPRHTDIVREHVPHVTHTLAVLDGAQLFQKVEQDMPAAQPVDDPLNITPESRVRRPLTAPPILIVAHDTPLYIAVRSILV